MPTRDDTMRTMFFAGMALVGLLFATAGPASADPPRHPAPARHLPPAPGYYPGWPWYPGPWPPVVRPRPRPPVVQIQYTVYYRPGRFAGWHQYGRFHSHARATAAAARLERLGYQTDVVVTYGR